MFKQVSTKYLNKLLIEALVISVLVVILGVLLNKIIKKINIFKNFKNKYHLEITLFLTGLITHIGFELFGGNRYYCKHGAACSL
jgi:uncharacterized membrane protein